MSPTTAQSIIRQIHAANSQMVIAITGGGSEAIGQLLSVPGGSRTLLEAIVPYSSQSLEEFLHARPEQFCSPRHRPNDGDGGISTGPALAVGGGRYAASGWHRLHGQSWPVTDPNVAPIAFTSHFNASIGP